MSGDTREFLVQGSEPLPYRVVFRRQGASLRATCTCKAGLIGMLCKHRLSILDGDKSAVVSDNGEEVAEVASWLIGSDVADAVSELVSLEAQKKEIESRIKRARKKTAEALDPRHRLK